MRVRPGESWHAAGACAVQVGAALHCNGSASHPSHAGPPYWERASCDGARCSGEDRRGERTSGELRDSIMGVRAVIPLK